MSQYNVAEFVVEIIPSRDPEYAVRHAIVVIERRMSPALQLTVTGPVSSPLLKFNKYVFLNGCKPRYFHAPYWQGGQKAVKLT